MRVMSPTTEKIMESPMSQEEINAQQDAAYDALRRAIATAHDALESATTAINIYAHALALQSDDPAQTLAQIAYTNRGGWSGGWINNMQENLLREEALKLLVRNEWRRRPLYKLRPMKGPF
jgi:hypothetical protein